MGTVHVISQINFVKLDVFLCFWINSIWAVLVERGLLAKSDHECAEIQLTENRIHIIILLGIEQGNAMDTFGERLSSMTTSTLFNVCLFVFFLMIPMENIYKLTSVCFDKYDKYKSLNRTNTRFSILSAQIIK